MIMVLLRLIGQQTHQIWTMVVGNQEEDERHQTQQSDDLKAAIRATCASLHLSSATDWSPPYHAALMQ